MAKCDEGYPCDVCGGDVDNITVSELYLRYVIGWVHPETLHTAQDRHIRCNPALAQYVVDEKFEPVTVEGPWDKRLLDPDFVRERETLLSRGFRRLREVLQLGLPIIEYPLPEVLARLRDEARGYDADRPSPAG